MYPDLVIRENQTVTISSADSIFAPGRTLAEEEWENKRDSYTVGVHTVRLRVKDSAGEWSQWTEYTFTVIPNDNIQTERPDEDGPVRIDTLTDNMSIGGTILVDESMTFDLTQLSFLLRYTDDSTRNISVYDTDVSPYLGYSLRPMLILARAILTSALERKETRGAHIREAYPSKNEYSTTYSLPSAHRTSKTKVTEGLQ